MLNAAINARDAMPKGGRLTLSTHNCRRRSDEVCVAVTDTGEGMRQDILEPGFEPFFTTKSVGKGTGLGLSQIHGFAAQTGGRAEIDFDAGRGHDAAHLSAANRQRPQTPPPEARRIIACADRQTILLVEDNELVRAFADGLLTELGYA